MENPDIHLSGFFDFKPKAYQGEKFIPRRRIREALVSSQMPL